MQLAARTFRRTDQNPRMVSRHHAETPLATKQLILDAASEIFAEVGYQRMTIDEVARRANLGKGTIYLYFDSKQDLALSIVDRINERLRERLRAIVKSPGTAEERLSKMLMERVMFRFSCVENYREGVDQMLGCLRTHLLARRKSYMEQEAVIYVEILVEGRTRGEFECDDPLDTAHALLTATASLLPYSLSPSELGSRKQVEARASSLIALLLRALRPCGDQMGMTVRGNI